MMLAPAVAPAVAFSDTPAAAVDGVRTTPKTSRLPRAISIVPARARPQAATAPSACTPSSIAPSRPGPVAYV
jgi:hypothetical protein